MMRPVLMILSLMVIAVISNPVDDQVSDDRTFGINRCPNGCQWVANFRKDCSNNFATSCSSNANCSGDYGVCTSYSVLKGPAGKITYESHSGNYCTKSASTCGISCSDAASKTSCTLF